MERQGIGIGIASFAWACMELMFGGVCMMD